MYKMLPFPELVVEDIRVVDDDAVEEPVERIPGVEGLPADPVVTARLGDVAGDLLGEARPGLLRRAVKGIAPSSTSSGGDRAAPSELLLVLLAGNEKEVSSVHIQACLDPGGTRGRYRRALGDPERERREPDHAGTILLEEHLRAVAAHR